MRDFGGVDRGGRLWLWLWLWLLGLGCLGAHESGSGAERSVDGPGWPGLPEEAEGRPHIFGPDGGAARWCGIGCKVVDGIRSLGWALANWQDADARAPQWDVLEAF